MIQTDIPEKEQRILRHCQTMAMLTNCLEIEFYNDLVDARWKSANMNNHVRRIKESINQLKLGLAFKFKVKDRDLIDNEHAVEVHRIFKYFSTMETGQLRQICDAYEEYDKLNPPIVYTEQLNNQTT